MTPKIEYLQSLSSLAKLHNIRFGVVLNGSLDWRKELLHSAFSNINVEDIFELGSCCFSGSRQVNVNQGQRLLGQECHLLICDFTLGFNANSFSSAIGTLVGGGILVVLGMPNSMHDFASLWLTRAFGKLHQLSEHERPLLPSIELPTYIKAEDEQSRAVTLIQKVVTGHRKRPLILTADRGRGKSSALGIAAANLMKSRTLDIVVTAPTLSNVSPVFEHAQRVALQQEAVTLNHDSELHQRVDTTREGVLRVGNSTLRFIAPDDVLRNSIHCDLLLVDEAAAIPLPMLKKMVEKYHRLVFSTTIHGYEGSGRGFTLKFIDWLKANRPGSQTYHLESPYRWRNGDPLEKWHYDSMLLNVELDDVSTENNVETFLPFSSDDAYFTSISKAELYEHPTRFQSIFALLVNAHYQTTPNDLFQILGDDAVHVYALYSDSSKANLLGCLLTVDEGELDGELVNDILIGKRRPKGHLVASSIANHFSMKSLAQAKSCRIIRIAVNPEYHRLGYGMRMLELLRHTQANYHYFSTSFGLTAELHLFWHHCGYSLVKVGSQRDATSGCHSAVMVSGSMPASDSWIRDLNHTFNENLPFILPGSLCSLEHDVVRSIFKFVEVEALPSHNIQMLTNFISGGNSFDACAHIFLKLANRLTAHQLSPLYIDLVVKKLSWAESIERNQQAGKKMAEKSFKKDISILLGLFTV